MHFENLVLEISDRIATVTVNRPEALNALNWASMEELQAVFLAMATDPDVGGIIITGSGEKAFVAGADIKELASRTPVAAKEFALASQKILGYIEEFPKPVIAAVNGFCLGGGCELAMACHLRIAADTSKFGQPEVNLGIIPGNGGTQRLPRLVGKGRALQLLLSGAFIDAQEAYRIGLVNQVVPLTDLIGAARRFMRTLLQKSPLAMQLCLQAVHHGLAIPLEQGVQLEANLFGLCFASEDAREGIQAFIEKRTAEFKGK